MVAIELVIKIFFGIIIGFLLFKLKILNKQTNAALSRALVELICPFLTLSSILSISGTDMVEKTEVYRILLTGVVIYIILIPFSYLLTRLLNVKPFSRGAFQCLLVFGNVGFIGIPVADSLYGAVGVFYIALLTIHFSLLTYTYALWLITKDSDTGYQFSAKRLINSGLICVVISLIFFFLDIRIPPIILSPISFIGNLTAPLSMLVLGSSIAAYDLNNIFKHWRVYVITAVRMILFPIAAFMIMRMIFGACMLTDITVFYVGMPTSLLAVMFSQAYGGDRETAASGTAIMNIFCIVTIPLIYLMITLL